MMVSLSSVVSYGTRIAVDLYHATSRIPGAALLRDGNKLDHLRLVHMTNVPTVSFITGFNLTMDFRVRHILKGI